jgi:hypothetical protein
MRVEQPRDRVVRVLPVVLSLGGRLVAADLGLAPQVSDDGVRDLPRRQRRAGVVQMDDMLDTGRVGADCGDVDQAVTLRPDEGRGR